MPSAWHELYRMLKNTRQKASGSWEPAAPLILAAWYDTPIATKSSRFLEHLRWARDHDQLQEIGEYLRSLREDEWYHFEDR